MDIILKIAMSASKGKTILVLPYFESKTVLSLRVTLYLTLRLHGGRFLSYFMMSIESFNFLYDWVEKDLQQMVL